jgi:FkbM family methyltransferase
MTDVKIGIDDPRASVPADLRERIEQLSIGERLRLADWLHGSLTWANPLGFDCSLRSLYEWKRFRKAKSSDKPLVAWIQGFVPGDVFYDIGSNVGTLALLAGTIHGAAVTTYAFEPSFSTFEALVRNVIINSLLGVVHPLQIALHDRTGLESLRYQDLRAGAALHAVGEAVDYLGRSFQPVASQPVLAVRIDDLIEMFGVRAPTRIKLDVDGNELRILHGAAATLGRPQLRDLVVEAVRTDAADARPDVLSAFLESKGFQLRHAVEHGPVDVYPRIFDYYFGRG